MGDFQICISVPLSYGIRMEIPILIGVQKGYISS